MNPQGVDLLAELRDIHAAPQVPWWPPAPGWWLLAILLLAGLVFFARNTLHRKRVRRRQQALEHYLDSLEASIDPQQHPQQFLAAINRVFKVVAVAAFPGMHCEHMSGAEWSAFLCSRLSGGDATDVLAALEKGPYQCSPTFDRAELIRLAKEWVRAYG